MAIGLVMQFKGLGAQQYDAIMNEMGLAANAGDWPDGLISHVAGATPTGWCVVDVWESQEQFDDFLNGRLLPAFDATGGRQDPEVTPIQVHVLHAHGGVLARR